MKIAAFADPREAVATLTGRLGWSLAATSRAIDAGDRYLDRFVREGRPRELAPPVRRRLARILDTDERNLMPRGGIGIYDGFYDPKPVSAYPLTLRYTGHRKLEVSIRNGQT